MKRICRHCFAQWVESPFRVCEDCDEPRETAEWREEAEEGVKQERRRIVFKLAAQTEELSRLMRESGKRVDAVSAGNDDRFILRKAESHA